jgi:hypothetical protein
VKLWESFTQVSKTFAQQERSWYIEHLKPNGLPQGSSSGRILRHSNALQRVTSCAVDGHPEIPYDRDIIYKNDDTMPSSLMTR